jgi:histidyl-tRNA synthetase
MYSFESRSGDRITLRPENTAGVVRAFLERGLRTKMAMPARLFYIGPMFRYERPQKGRQRQFHQLGVEVIDTADARADVDVILVACEYLRELGIDDLVVDLNSLGDPDDRVRFREALVQYLESVRDRLDPDSVDRIERNPLRVLDSKNEGTRAALANAPSILDHLGTDAAEHFALVQDRLTAAGVAFRINPTLVRGLDYYSRTTFEIHSSRLGAQSALCGGGRYDGLVEELGGPAVSAVGWALGLERLAIVLDEMRGAPSTIGPTAFVIAQGEDAERESLRIVRDLRRDGVSCELSLIRGAFGKQFKAADRRGAKYCIVLAEEEMKNGTASVKELATGEQREIPRAELAARLLRGEGSS